MDRAAPGDDDVLSGDADPLVGERGSEGAMGIGDQLLDHVFRQRDVRIRAIGLVEGPEREHRHTVARP